MPRNTLLTIDLPEDAGSAQRERFYDVLAARGWIKVNFVTTAWSNQLADSLTLQEAEDKVKLHLATAASTAGIRVYDAAVQIGNNAVRAL